MSAVEGEALLDEVEQDIQGEASNVEKTAKDTVTEVAQPDGQLVAPMLSMLAQAMAPNWNVTDGECLNVGVAAETFINETWGGLDNVPAWATLLLTVAMVVAPRIGTPLRAVEAPVHPDDVSKVEEKGAE